MPAFIVQLLPARHRRMIPSFPGIAVSVKRGGWALTVSKRRTSVNRIRARTLGTAWTDTMATPVSASQGSQVRTTGLGFF